MNFERAKEYIKKNAPDGCTQGFALGIINALESKGEPEPQEIKVGDVVEVRDHPYVSKLTTDLIGKRGIFAEENSGLIAVEFFEKVNGGHGCAGFTKTGHGYWFNKRDLKFIARPSYAWRK